MPNSPLRVVFAGTPGFAASHLGALIESEHQLTGVYTQPDRRAGRGKKLQATPVKLLAADADIPVFQPASLKSAEAQTALAALQADVLVVVAYGLILPQPVLDIPNHGCLNVHASLLPRWRGAAPIQRAIEAGDETTGITIMQMDAGLDTGDMLATASCPIGTHNAASLHDELARLGPPLLLQVLSELTSYQKNAQAQTDDQACYAQKLLKSEAEVDWSRGVLTLERQVRAFNPFPICFSYLGPERVRIWEAASLADKNAPDAPGTIVRADANGIVVSCGDGLLAIRKLQLAGGKVLSAEQVLNARRDLFAAGASFQPYPAAR